MRSPWFSTPRSLLFLLPLLAVVPTLASDTSKSIWAEIRVLDAATRRGVPLVELETISGLRFVTDNAGRIAFHEPGLLNREIYFSVRSHGYEKAKDGFGFAGARIVPKPGQSCTIEITRKNLAERLCRLTGEGLYRDSVLLGYKVPLANPLTPGLLAGQDTVQAALYRGKGYWFWGDTNRLNYPLGLFRTAGATTPLPDTAEGGFDPAGGIAFHYFTDRTGFVRAMMPLPERPAGVIWIHAVFVVADADGKDRLLGHYSRRKGLAEELEQGIALYDDENDIFRVARQLPLKETWRRPSGHPILHEEAGQRWLLFGSPSPNVRVRATVTDVLDPSKYEAFTCMPAEKDSKPVWRWQKELPPLDSKTEARLVKEGKLSPLLARFSPTDMKHPGTGVVLHSGSVRWNAYRKCWVLLAGQFGGTTSLLGEVWYAEADHPTGPFTRAIKVVTHDRQTFYNVCHHAFLDREGGRWIHFEGTYTNDFSGNPDKTPRYNYNQVLYRLDLANPELRPGRP